MAVQSGDPDGTRVSEVTDWARTGSLGRARLSCTGIDVMEIPPWQPQELEHTHKQHAFYGRWLFETTKKGPGTKPSLDSFHSVFYFIVGGADTSVGGRDRNILSRSTKRQKARPTGSANFNNPLSEPECWYEGKNRREGNEKFCSATWGKKIDRVQCMYDIHVDVGYAVRSSLIYTQVDYCPTAS
jgi:hypothetical protein